MNPSGWGRPLVVAGMVVASILSLRGVRAEVSTTAFDPASDGKRVSEMLRRREFGDLEAWYEALRSAKARSETGGWLTGRFFDALENGAAGTSPGEPERYLATFLDWTKKHPRSPAARVALVKAHMKVAWGERGSGFGHQISDEGLEGFKKHVALARTAFEEAEGLPNPDPALYEAAIDVAMAEGRPIEETLALFEKGAAIEPCYLSLHRAMTHFLLPRWYGDEEAMREFAERSVELTKAREGESYYVRVAGHVHTVEGREKWRGFGFDWPRLSRGWDDMHRLWPDSPGFRDFLAWAACDAKDQEKAREIFALLPEALPERPSNAVWRGAPEYESFRAWARGEGEYPTSNDLVDAILADDEATALALVANGVSLEIDAPDGATALSRAVMAGMADLVDAMLEKGADPNRAGKGSGTPMLFASMSGAPWLVDALAAAGADPNRPDATGNTPLIWALNQNDAPVVETLLLAGAKPDVPGREGWTPLCFAIFMKYFDLAELLLDNGASASLAMPGWNPTLLAARAGSVETVRRLLKEGAPPDEPVASGETAILGAATQGHDDVVVELAATGRCDLGRKDRTGNTPLHWAAIKCGPAAIRALLDAGADPKVRNKVGQTPLVAARMRPSAREVVPILEAAESAIRSRN